MAEFNPSEYSGNINLDPNPLRKYFRQPKVYITLPSKGKYYPEGALEITENGEYPVLAMTAKDELAMKTPDALLNGQSTVDVIQSCVPNIKDAWKLPSVDLDAILIAIRIATYGEEMELTTKIPNIGEERAFNVDLRQLLNKLVTSSYDDYLDLGDMKIRLRPLTYSEFTEASLKTFEEQRIFALVNDEEISDGEKLKRFNKSFKTLTDLTVNTLTQSIIEITVGDDTVANPLHIAEFVDNADKNFFTTITEHLDAQKAKFSIEPMKVKSSEEDIAAGAPAEWSIPITFDQSNFFG